jgi:hypothetical protein
MHAVPLDTDVRALEDYIQQQQSWPLVVGNSRGHARILLRPRKNWAPGRQDLVYNNNNTVFTVHFQPSNGPETARQGRREGETITTD